MSCMESNSHEIMCIKELYTPVLSPPHRCQSPSQAVLNPLRARLLDAKNLHDILM